MTVALIPCYNVEKFCKKVIEKTLPLVDHLILINDGSTDGTQEIVEAFVGSALGKVSLISYPKNRGKGIALLQGMQKALGLGFQTLVTLDSDGQHLPSEMHSLLAMSREGADLVIGSRDFSRMPMRSRIGNTIITFLLKIRFRKAPRETQSGYRAMNQRLVKQIVQHIHSDRYEMELECILLALCNGFTIRECPIQTIYINENASSSFSALKDSIRVVWALLRHWSCNYR